MAAAAPGADKRLALLAALLCWAGFAIVAALVATHRSDGWDAAGLLFWRQSGNAMLLRGPPWLGELARDYTALGGPLLRNLFALAAALALLLRRARVAAVMLAVTVCGAWLVEVLLKMAVGRARPVVVPHLMGATGNSFPSGHSFNSAAVYVAAALAFAPLLARPLARWSLLVAALGLTLLVALTRVMLGVHYPTDAIGGWLGGTGWAFTGSALTAHRARLANPGQPEIHS